VRIIRAHLCAVFLAAAMPVSAQIQLFEHDNYGGASIELYDYTPDFASNGMNDRASSVIVRGSSWQLCEHANFGGRCVTLTPGSYPSLGSMGMNDVASSARPLGGGPPSPSRPPIGGGAGGRVVLYEGMDFTGRSIGIDQLVSNLDRVGLNDRAVSVVVYDGTWELCEHEDFRGDCMTLGPGQYPELGRLNRKVSSLRPAGYAPPGTGPAPIPPAGASGRGRVILYEGSNFAGRQLAIDRNRFPNFADIGFNDRASSLRVERGYWLFCSDANFEGECRTFGPGDYPYLPPGLNNRISSGRRISDDYPYTQNPDWGGR
jgi:hypothetical protein